MRVEKLTVWCGGMQVSAFGDDSKSDTGDVWFLTSGGGKAYDYWQREQKVHHLSPPTYLCQYTFCDSGSIHAV